MNRDWLTLAFGVALVGGVVSLSLRQHAVPDAAGEVTVAAAPAEPALTPPPPAPVADPPPPAKAARTTRERQLAPQPAPARKGPAPDSAVPPAQAPAAVVAHTPLASATLALPSVAPAAARQTASIPVVHRHAMGSCQGTLLATSRGLTFETEHKTDGFSLAFADIDEFEVEYLKKNLRVQRRGGRTWNFTNDSADGLFLFHRNVNKTRERQAAAAR